MTYYWLKKLAKAGGVGLRNAEFASALINDCISQGVSGFCN